MTFKALDAGTLVEPSKLTVRQGSVDRRILRFSAFEDGALRVVKEFVSPLTASVSPASLFPFSASSSPSNTTSSTATASPTGGIGPFTYQWALVSSTGGNTAIINTSTNATTFFTKPNVPAFSVFTDVFSVTITDDFGSTATAQVTVQFENAGDFS